MPLLQAAEEKAKKSAQRWRRQAAEVEHLKAVELRLWEEVRTLNQRLMTKCRLMHTQSRSTTETSRKFSSR